MTLHRQPGAEGGEGEADAEAGGAAFEMGGRLGGPGGAGDVEVDEGRFLGPES